MAISRCQLDNSSGSNNKSGRNSSSGSNIDTACSQIPGGLLSERRGGKWPFGLGVLCTSVLTLASPLAARWGGAWGFALVRAAEGLGEGVTFPAMQAMIARWTPIGERSRREIRIYLLLYVYLPSNGFPPNCPKASGEMLNIKTAGGRRLS